MNKSIRLFLLAAVLLTAAGVIYAQGKQIYTWTDANGVVHYVDTPPDHANAVSMDAPEAYRPGSADAYPAAEAADSIDADRPASEGISDAESPGDADSPVDTESPGDAEASYADQKREQMARRREQQRKDQAVRQQNCALARQQIAAMEPARRVYFTNAQGETERMDDEERVRKVKEAKALAAKNCD